MPVPAVIPVCQCRWRWCCCWRWHCALRHYNVLCLDSPFLCICHLPSAPTSLSSLHSSCPHAERCPVPSWGLSHAVCGPSNGFSSPPLPCLSGGFRLLCAPTAECDVVSFAVRAFRLCVATEKALLCNAPHNIALMGAGAVWAWAVAACWFAAALDFNLGPSATMLSSAVWAYVREWFDSVPHSRRLDACFQKRAGHLVPFHYQDNWRCGDLTPRSPIPEAMRVHQPSHVDWNYHSFVLSLDLIPLLLQALCPFAHVPHKWYCMDF